MVSNLILCDVNGRFDLCETSPSSSIDSSIMFLVHWGNLTLHGVSRTVATTTIDTAINTGIAETYGRAHFSKRA